MNVTKLDFAEDKPGIVRAATQYAVDKRVLDLATFDVTQNPLRSGALFDAIITDPPCTLHYGTVTMIVLTNVCRWRASRR
jgi:tRNA G10  N-methylase Trm11